MSQAPLRSLLPLSSVYFPSHPLLLFPAAPKLPFPRLFAHLSFLPVLSQLLPDQGTLLGVLHTRPGPGEAEVRRALEPHSGNSVVGRHPCSSPEMFPLSEGMCLSPRNKSGAGNFRFQSTPAKELAEGRQLPGALVHTALRAPESSSDE